MKNMTLKAILIATLASVIVGCAGYEMPTERYSGATANVPCDKQYTHIANIGRCEYDTGYNTNG